MGAVGAIVALTSAPFFLRPTKKNRRPIRARAITPPMAIPAIAPVDKVTLPEEEEELEDGGEVEVLVEAVVVVPSPIQFSPGERE